MKTVRFSKVVERSSKPEVYLLLTKDDPVFKRALKASRIMTVLSKKIGPKMEYGLVGYNDKQRGQILMFPKSLKTFEGMKVVGIKYDVFAGEIEKKIMKTPAPTKPSSVKDRATKTKMEKSFPNNGTKKTEKMLLEKVIQFPKPELETEDEDEKSEDLKGYVRQAMRQLEKGNGVAAYNLLKRID